MLVSDVVEGLAQVACAAFTGRCGVWRRSAVMFLCLDSFILGSFDKDDGPQLYMVDPSGISYVSSRLTCTGAAC